MDVTPLASAGVPVIQSYKSGVFRISGIAYDHPVAVSMDGVIRWDETFENLPQHDVLLYGTGAEQIWPSPELRVRVPMEVMTTAAACRTYNALITEGRAVTALLLPHI